MDDDRETSVQSCIFLILTCYSFENYLLSIRQSILNIISKILQSFSEEIYQFNRYAKQEILDSLSAEKTVSPLKEDTVLIFKHDECVAAILADIANKSRVEK